MEEGRILERKSEDEKYSLSFWTQAVKQPSMQSAASAETVIAAAESRMKHRIATVVAAVDFFIAAPVSDLIFRFVCFCAYDTGNDVYE